ncbi:hypothetical protein ES708_20057 [subsurface metagenome]
MCIHTPAPESYVLSEIPFELHQVHVGRCELYRVEDIQSRVNEIGQYNADRSAGMHEGLHMRQPFLYMRKEGFDPGDHQDPQGIWIDDGGALCSQVVAFGDNLNPLCLSLLYGPVNHLIPVSDLILQDDACQPVNPVRIHHSVHIPVLIPPDPHRILCKSGHMAVRHTCMITHLSDLMIQVPS